MTLVEKNSKLEGDLGWHAMLRIYNVIKVPDLGREPHFHLPCFINFFGLPMVIWILINFVTN